MAITIEDVRKAVETITLYCDEFEQSFTQRMEPLKGDDINHLCDDRGTTRNIKNYAAQIQRWISKLTFK